MMYHMMNVTIHRPLTVFEEVGGDGATPPGLMIICANCGGHFHEGSCGGITSVEYHLHPDRPPGKRCKVCGTDTIGIHVPSRTVAGMCKVIPWTVELYGRSDPAPPEPTKGHR
jgi:hypothetical protein